MHEKEGDLPCVREGVTKLTPLLVAGVSAGTRAEIAALTLSPCAGRVITTTKAAFRTRVSALLVDLEPRELSQPGATSTRSASRAQSVVYRYAGAPL